MTFGIKPPAGAIHIRHLTYIAAIFRSLKLLHNEIQTSNVNSTVSPITSWQFTTNMQIIHLSDIFLSWPYSTLPLWIQTNLWSRRSSFFFYYKRIFDANNMSTLDIKKHDRSPPFMTSLLVTPGTSIAIGSWVTGPHNIPKTSYNTRVLFINRFFCRRLHP